MLTSPPPSPARTTSHSSSACTRPRSPSTTPPTKSGRWSPLTRPTGQAASSTCAAGRPPTRHRPQGALAAPTPGRCTRLGRRWPEPRLPHTHPHASHTRIHTCTHHTPLPWPLPWPRPRPCRSAPGSGGPALHRAGPAHQPGTRLLGRRVVCRRCARAQEPGGRRPRAGAAAARRVCLSPPPPPASSSHACPPFPISLRSVPPVAGQRRESPRPKDCPEHQAGAPIPARRCPGQRRQLATRQQSARPSGAAGRPPSDTLFKTSAGATPH
jgi:hypothetical protein